MLNSLKNEINIFTDGSCNSVYGIGGWAAIIISGKDEMLLKGKELETTHNRMELLAVIKALEYIENQNLANYKIIVNSDSQYVVRLIERKEKLQAAEFLTKKGNVVRNRDLVENILNFIESLNLEFVKVKAHQKKTEERNYNRDVDKMARKIVREAVGQWKVRKLES